MPITGRGTMLREVTLHLFRLVKTMVDTDARVEVEQGQGDNYIPVIEAEKRVPLLKIDTPDSIEVLQ